MCIILYLPFVFIDATIQLYKKAYAGLSKETWLLSIVILINRCGTMVLPFLSIYCTQQLHFSITQTGIVMAVFGAGAIAGALVSGRIVDKIGFYYVQVISLLLGGILFFVVAAVHDFSNLCLSVFWLSFFNESFRPANSTAIAHYSTEENRTRSYAVNRLAVNLGFAVGGVLGGYLAAHNYTWLFWVDGITNITSVFLLLKLLPVIKIIKQGKEEIAKGLSPYKDKQYLFFIGSVILFAFCFLQLFGMEPVFLKTSWHLTEQNIGFVMAMNGLLIACFELVIIHTLEGKKSNLFFIRVGVFLIAVGFISFNILPATFFSAIIATLFLTIGEIFALPFMNSYWISRTNQHNRGRYAALYTTAWSVAHVAAPTIGSFVAGSYSFAWLWWIVGIICMGVMGMLYYSEK